MGCPLFLVCITVLGTVKTISGTFLLQPSVHNTYYIRKPRIQPKIKYLSLSQWHLKLRHRK